MRTYHTIGSHAVQKNKGVKNAAINKYRSQGRKRAEGAQRDLEVLTMVYDVVGRPSYPGC